MASVSGKAIDWIGTKNREGAVRNMVLHCTGRRWDDVMQVENRREN